MFQFDGSEDSEDPSRPNFDPECIRDSIQQVLEENHVSELYLEVREQLQEAVEGYRQCQDQESDEAIRA